MSEARFILGIDLGGTHVKGLVVDESGRSLDTFRALLYTEGPERSGRLTATPQGDDGSADFNELFLRASRSPVWDVPNLY